MSMKLTILVSSVILFVLSAQGATPVETHGRLHIDSNKIVDQHGNPVQLRGMSMFWSQWGSEYYKKSTVDWLAKDWNISVIRAVMAVENGGYLSFPESQAALVDTIVQAALSNGIYVIIDWHDHKAHLHTSSAKLFFESMAQKYEKYPNIIYEIFNEPEQIAWSTVKAYADTIIRAIRTIDDSNLIAVGTPNWCQYVTDASSDPITGFANIAYTLHFYAATHNLWLRNKAKIALSKGIPLFVTEWGTCEYTGNGAIDLMGTSTWMQFLDEHKISSCNWSVNYKNESASALKTTASPNGNWKTDDLRQSGLLLRSLLRGYSGVDAVDSVLFKQVFDTIPLPGRMEAEKFASGQKIQRATTDDLSGTEHVFMEKGGWFTTIAKMPVKSKLSFQMRISGAVNRNALSVYINDTRISTLNIPDTNTNQSWITISTSGNITIDTGRHLLRVVYSGDSGNGMLKVNWMDFVPENSIIRSLQMPASGVDFTIAKHGITVSLPTGHTLNDIMVYNANGVIVRRKNIIPSYQSVIIDNLPNGYFIFRLSGKNSFAQPIIINR